MSRSMLALRVVAVSAALTLVGCSGDDADSDAGTDPSVSSPVGTASGGQTTDPDTDETTDTDDDSGGEASGDLVAWADEFCGAIAPLQDSMTDSGSLIPDMSDPTAALPGMIDMISTFADSFRAASDAVSGVGAPPIENGDEVYDQMVTLLADAGDSFDDAAAQIGELDPNDPASFEQIAPIMQQFGTQFEESGEAIDQTFESPEMQAAFDEAPACEGMDM